jgi:sulfur-oxidizing protein SoxY
MREVAGSNPASATTSTVTLYRRVILKAGTAATLAAIVGLRPRAAAAEGWNQAAFGSKTLDDIIKALGGSGYMPTKDVSWGSTPDIAENGAAVQVSVTSAIPRTQAIAIVIEKNPGPLAAQFEVPPGTDPAIVTRFKMAQTSNVHAVVKADGKYFVSTRQIRVTFGGCG